MEDMEAKMDFSAVVKERFSCKKFDAEKKLSKGLVEKILESGRLAPTAKNLQEQHIYVARPRMRFPKSTMLLRADMERRSFLLWHSTRTMCIHIRATKEIPE